MDPQHIEFPAQPPDAARARARSWFAARLGHPDAGAAGAELHTLVVPHAGETIRLTITQPAGRVRLSVYGRNRLPPAVRHSPAWARLLVLAGAVGVTPDGAGVWAEL
jgi:hypothetical protein